MARVILSAVVHREDNLSVAECAELGTVSQGRTIEEAAANPKEATGLSSPRAGGPRSPGYSDRAFVTVPKVVRTFGLGATLWPRGRPKALALTQLVPDTLLPSQLVLTLSPPRRAQWLSWGDRSDEAARHAKHW